MGKRIYIDDVIMEFIVIMVIIAIVFFIIGDYIIYPATILAWVIEHIYNILQTL